MSMMDDELSYDSVTPHGQAAGSPTVAIQADAPTIDDLLSQATMRANVGGPGANKDEAETWLNQQMASLKDTKPAGIDSGVVNYGDVKPYSPVGKELSFDAVKPVGKADFSGVVGSVEEPPGMFMQGLNDIVEAGGNYAKRGTESLGNLFGSAGAYFKNYHDTHETFEPGNVTPQEKAVAKLMGISNPGNASAVTDPNNPYYDQQAANSHGLVYKMTPEQREELNDKAMEAWGFTPKQERARVEASSQGDWKDLDVVGGVATKSLMANVAERLANPQIANTRKYYALQDTVKAMDAVANPDKYSPEFVKESAAKIEAYKKQLGQSGWDEAKEMWQQALKKPGKTVKSLAYGIAQDPELAMIPEAKVGSLAMGSKIARVGEATAEASKIAKLADAVKGAAAANPEIAANAAKNAEVYSRVAERAGLTQKAAQRAANLGDAASVVGSGAGLNAEISAQEQMHDKGYVRQGSLAAPAIAGAAFGAVAHGVGSAVGGVRGLKEDLQDRVETARTYETGSDATHIPDVNTGKAPGEPLSPDTPINKSSHVPFYGGVDASGKVIHIDEKTPSFLPIKNVDGKKVNIPVLKTVAYHEQVEYPLMHMEGPISTDTLIQLQNRIGKEGTISPEVMQKLKDGTSLSYQEAHEIATLAENHLVRTLYKTDPKVYQDSLRPYIKNVEKANKDAAPSDIPVGLDAKPYEDMGQKDVLKGQGDVPAIDKGQKGNINNKLLATGVTVGAGATAGSLLAPEGQKQSGAILGGTAGLFAGMNMWGDSLPTKGLGNKERGMFAGPRAATHNSFKMAVANRLEREGIPPEQIHKETGLHRAAGGTWTHELPDDNIKLYESTLKTTDTKLNPKGQPIPLWEALKHPELEKAYPSLVKNLKVRQRDLGGGMAGYYNPEDHMITLNDPSYLRWLSKSVGDPAIAPEAVLLHEVQHAIQHVEKMPSGDTPVRHELDMEMERSALEDRWERLRIMQAEAKVAKQPEKVEKIQAVLSDIDQKLHSIYTPAAIEAEAARRYKLSAGEQQAFNVQTRKDMTPEERASSFPPSTMDVPIEKQLVRYNEKDAAYHQLTLDEHLRKTGEGDEEGHLYGMSLAEDRLPNERAIVDRAKTGDQKAIGDLYRKYMPRLERTMRSLMRDVGPRLGLDSEDIASQAFMKAMQALPSFEGGSAFYTWLYKIGRNEALNAIDKGNRTVPTSSMYRATFEEGGLGARQGGIEDTGGSPIRSDVEGVAGSHDTPEAMATAQQASNMVHHAISKLPQDIREAVKMKDLAGMTEQEIADAMGVPVGTVKSRLSRGRDMIQQSIKRGHGAQFRTQGGFATPEGLKKLAKISLLAGAGGTLGAVYLNPEHPLKGAWAGAAIALVGGEVNWSKLFPSIKNMMAEDKRVNVNTLLDNYDAALATSQRTTAQVQYKIDKMVPNKESQKKITYWLDGDKSIPLTPQEYAAAKVARQFYDSIGQAALHEGVLKDFLADYINHEWGDSAKAKALQDQIASSFATNMSPKNRHALARKFMTLDQGKKAGLVPRTENVNELIGIYANSMSKAMANKTLLDALKVTVVDPTKGIKAVMGASKAPYNYVPIQHPQLNGVRVHPSIAPSLDFLFHTTNRGVITSAVEGLNTATKRMEVSLSLFHVKALIDAFAGANPLSHPIRNLVDIATSMAGKSRGHKEYIEGGAGDTTDLLISGGLRVDPRKGKISDEDVNTGFYEALDGLQQFMNQTVPGSGKAIGLVKKANKLSDKFIWENVHTGLKLTTAMNAYERLGRSHAQELLKDPNYKMPSDADIAKQAASFTNDTFGGLNWRRLADDATTKIGRNLALTLANPAGRRLSQVMMFAPDWTYSTIRSFFKAAGAGSGFGGLLRPKTLADLHRQYLIRSSIIYLTLYNAVNMAMSGHPIWENEDPLTVDLGNGERMQANKHFMETPHMLLNPAKFALGKLGIIPSEILEQALHKEYLTTGQMPDMKGGRIEHLAKRLMPFSGESLQQQGTPEMMMNMLGFPIYGKHAPRTQEEADAIAEKKKAAARKGAETRRAKREKEMYGE